MPYPETLAPHPSLHPTASDLRAERRASLRDAQAARIARIEAAASAIADLALEDIGSAEHGDLCADDAALAETRAALLERLAGTLAAQVEHDRRPAAFVRAEAA